MAGVLSAIAVVVATCSMAIAYMAYRIAVRQTLPHPDIGWMSVYNGHRSLDFKITRTPGSADWVVAGASVRGNWRRRPYMARGYVVHAEEFEDDIYKTYGPTGPWQHRIIFDPPLTEGAIVLHPDTPDCEVKLIITLRTLPSPRVVRRIKLNKYQPRR